MALLAVLGIIVLLYVQPVSHWLQQRGTAAHSRADLRELEAENARLERRLRALSGPRSIEHQARSMGMVKQGERSYVIQDR